MEAESKSGFRFPLGEMPRVLSASSRNWPWAMGFGTTFALSYDSRHALFTDGQSTSLLEGNPGASNHASIRY